MKKTMKKILALVLTMVMLLSVAAPVFANDTVAPECPEVHTKEKLGEGNYTFISKHEPVKCSDITYNVYQCNACKEYFADDIKLGVACTFVTVTEATCAVPGLEKCTVCNYEQETTKEHDWDVKVTCGYGDEKVTQKCKNCDATREVDPTTEHDWTITVTKEPVCKTPGTANYKCNICGFEKNVEVFADPDHESHTWKLAEAQTGYCYGEGEDRYTITAGYYCPDCDTAARVGQAIFVEGETVINMSLYTKTLVEHAYVRIEQAATCTDYGFIFYACTVCAHRDTDRDEIVDPLKHKGGYDINDRVVIDDVKCTYTEENDIKTLGTVGTVTYQVHCTLCNEDVVWTENHTIKTGEVELPTCENKGYTYDYCVECDLKFNNRGYTDADPNAHDWIKDEKDAETFGDAELYGIKTAPTCVTPGKAYTTCKICGASDTEVILEATGHKYTDIQIDCLAGEYVKTCELCPEGTEGKTIRVEIEGFDYNDVDALTTYHDIIKVDYKAKPDCATGAYGITLYTCSRHGEAIEIHVKAEHDLEIITPADKGDCVTDGHVGFAKCKNCDYTVGVEGDEGIIKARGEHEFEVVIPAKDATCTEKGHIGYKECKYCDATEGDANGEIDALGHLSVVIPDINPNGNNGADYGIDCTKYTYMHYGCTRCNAGPEKWTNYVAATGHNMKETTPAKCTEEGVMTCANGCGHTEAIAILKHKDAEGNVIECVSEDFYCYTCQADSEGNIPEGTKKINALESHYVVAVTDIIGFVKDCTEARYVLNVCENCKHEWTTALEIHDQHTKPTNPTDADWVVLLGDEPTFDKPGVESLLCACDYCDQVVETRPCYKEDVEFSFDFDNAVYAGAHLVNSGYLAVKVNLAAYQQALHSFMFSFEVEHTLNLNGQLLTFVGYEVPAEYSDVIYKKVYVGQDNNTVTVYATIENEIDSAVRDYTFTGSENHVLTLIFKINDMANTEASTEEATFTINGLATEVKKVDSTAVVESNYKKLEAPEVVTISILGSVNDDAETTDGVANQVDVNAIRKLVAERGYVAEADIDKDGNITLADFDLLAKYLVGNYTYAEICGQDLSKFA